MAPWAKVFKDPADPEGAMYNNFRVYGTALLCVMGKFLNNIMLFEFCLQSNLEFKTFIRKKKKKCSTLKFIE